MVGIDDLRDVDFMKTETVYRIKTSDISGYLSMLISDGAMEPLQIASEGEQLYCKTLSRIDSDDYKWYDYVPVSVEVKEPKLDPVTAMKATGQLPIVKQEEPSISFGSNAPLKIEHQVWKSSDSKMPKSESQTKECVTGESQNYEWVLLKEGDVIKEGDEYWYHDRRSWLSLEERDVIIGTNILEVMKPFRRRVSAPYVSLYSKLELQKKVEELEGKLNEEWDWNINKAVTIKKFNDECLMHTETIAAQKKQNEELAAMIVNKSPMNQNVIDLVQNKELDRLKEENKNLKVLVRNEEKVNERLKSTSNVKWVKRTDETPVYSSRESIYVTHNDYYCFIPKPPQAPAEVAWEKYVKEDSDLFNEHEETFFKAGFNTAKEGGV